MKSGKGFDPTPPEPPEGLTEYATAVWRQVVTRPKSHISAGRLEVLRLAFELLDDYSALKETIRREGFTIESKRSGLPRRHPLLRDYFELQKELIRTWTKVGLHWETDVDGRCNF